jgi:hypothetical protein
MIVNLSHGDIELVSHPGGNGLHYLPLILERVFSRQTEANLAYANIHNIQHPRKMW